MGVVADGVNVLHTLPVHREEETWEGEESLGGIRLRLPAAASLFWDHIKWQNERALLGLHAYWEGVLRRTGCASRGDTWPR